MLYSFFMPGTLRISKYVYRPCHASTQQALIFYSKVQLRASRSLMRLGWIWDFQATCGGFAIR